MHVNPPKLPEPHDPSGVTGLPLAIEVGKLVLETNEELGIEARPDGDDDDNDDKEGRKQLPKALWHPTPQYRGPFPQNPEEEQHGWIPPWLPVHVYPFTPPQVPSGVMPPVADGDGTTDDDEDELREDKDSVSSQTPPSIVGGAVEAPAPAAFDL